MVNIQLEWTPNPSTLKYVVDRPLLPRGAINFTDIPDVIEEALSHHDPAPEVTLEAVSAADSWARRAAADAVARVRAKR